jgi:pimeloyl-ACP methyl ester carboxylesterase
VNVTTLRHNRVELALHEVRGGSGRPLLLLHGLGEASPNRVPSRAAAWPGPVYGLDFTGHGASTIPVGGGYTAEILLGDVDAAVTHLGEVTIYGRGLGGYVALLAAGALPDTVLGAVIADGPGLTGGPTEPISPAVVRLAADRRPPDPYALLELGRDLRPVDYALDIVRLAVGGSELEEPIDVAAVFRPPWLDAVAAAPGVAGLDVPEALALYAG